MEITRLSSSRYFTIMLLLQMITSSSEYFEVNSLQGPILAPLGGEVELSCQLSPAQSAEHMEIRWFRDLYTQPVHLYRNGKDLYGEIISKYVERTQLLKEDITKGNVTLRILNVSADDDGKYHCIFRDGEFYEEAITEVKVTAASLEMQIIVHPPNIKGILVECNSGGWFPEPQMEWRDSNGEIIPPTSKSHSQNTAKLFNMKMTLLLSHMFYRNITCSLQNPVTGEEERTNIVLPDKLFLWNTIWIAILAEILALLLIFIVVPSVDLHLKLHGKCSCFRYECVSPSPQRGTCSCPLSIFSSTNTKISSCFNQIIDRFFKKIPTWLVGVIMFIISALTIILLICLLRFKERVSISDELFQVDTMWLEDITVILCILMVFILMIISFTYFKIRGMKLMDILDSRSEETPHGFP